MAFAPGNATEKSAGIPHSRLSVLGARYSMLGRQTIIDQLLHHAFRARPSGSPGIEIAEIGRVTERGGYVCVSNVHTTMTGVFNREYRRILNGSLLTVPDGVPLVWAMRTLGAPGQDRVRGPTLMRNLMDQGRRLGARHYLIGGSPAALEDLEKTLKENYPGVEIVGAESPPFKPLEALTSEEWAGQAARINASGAQFVWVGLGAPKQERWMARQEGAIKGVMLGVGAAFDLIPGRIPEAPAAMQKLGLEWLYRLYREPRRLWKRYLFNNPAFLLLWGGQVVMRLCGKKFVVAKQ
jgi:N-acetylglucosaminyldiphosphoundecaprenol N-acetyl-beta-D-mannosaminyltransferase